VAGYRGTVAMIRMTCVSHHVRQLTGVRRRQPVKLPLDWTELDCQHLTLVGEDGRRYRWTPHQPDFAQGRHQKFVLGASGSLDGPILSYSLCV